MKKSRILWLLSTLFLIAACVKNPVTGGRQLALISESQEISIGEASHPEILSEFGVVENPALQEYFSRIESRFIEVRRAKQLEALLDQASRAFPRRRFPASTGSLPTRHWPPEPL